MISQQETFDTVATALIKQGKPSVDSRGCVYRAPDGSKCAAGHLIPDELYTRDMERNFADGTIVGTVLAELGHDIQLVRQLQRCHDNAWLDTGGGIDAFMSELLRRLRDTAGSYKLSTAVLDELVAAQGAAA